MEDCREMTWGTKFFPKCNKCRANCAAWAIYSAPWWPMHAGKDVHHSLHMVTMVTNYKMQVWEYINVWLHEVKLYMYVWRMGLSIRAALTTELCHHSNNILLSAPGQNILVWRVWIHYVVCSGSFPHILVISAPLYIYTSVTLHINKITLCYFVLNMATSSKLDWKCHILAPGLPPLNHMAI